MDVPCSWCHHARQTEQTLEVYGNCKISNGNSCTICDEYATLESQIQETKRALDEQLERQRELREAMNSIHDPLAPNLPVEIISHIFQHSLTATFDEIIKDYFISGYPSLEEEQRSRLKLGEVCRAWRDIAWSTPQLWKFISIHTTSLGSELNSTSFMERWLSRTGDIPLWVLVACDDQSEGFPATHIDLINSYSHRWQNLAVHGDSRLMQSLVGQSQGAPILYTLDFCLVRIAENVPFRLAGPKPRPIRVSTNYLFAGKLDIEWDNVSVLSASFFDVEELLEILKNSPRLETLCIHHVDQLDTPLYTMSHQNLRSLTLNVPVELSFFEILKLPGLTSLSLGTSDSYSYDSLIFLLQNSSPILKELTINSFNDQQLFIHLLKHLPFLETLFIRHIGYVGLTFKKLLSLLCDTDIDADADFSQEDFLPNLQSLTIDDTYYSYLVDLPFNLGRTPNTRKRPLRSLILISSDNAPPKEIFF